MFCSVLLSQPFCYPDHIAVYLKVASYYTPTTKKDCTPPNSMCLDELYHVYGFVYPEVAYNECYVQVSLL